MTDVDASPEDRQLLAAVAHDTAAFEQFYRRHVDQIVGFVAWRCLNPEDVADIVASTFVVVLTSSRTYDPERGEPIAWLYGIAARLIANGRRRASRESAAIARLAGRSLVDGNDLERLEERLDARTESRAALHALRHLTEQHREALLLVGVQGLSPRDAARVLGIRAAAFRMRLTTARRALRVAIAADRDYPSAASPDFNEVTT